MGQGKPLLGKFMSKFLLMVVPGVTASAVAVFVLYAVHVSRTPEPIALFDRSHPAKRRALHRRAPRTHPPDAQGPPRKSAGTGPGAADPDAASLDHRRRRGHGFRCQGARRPRARARRRAPTGRPPAVARAKPEPAPAITAAVPAPAVAAPTTTAAIGPPVGPAAPAPPPASGDPTTLPPVVVNTPAPGAAPEPPPQRSFAGSVFSSISTMAGTAANATGNTVNWVIDLPGKAISAGGKLLGGDSASNNPPPPPAAPQPRRNLL